ncbi:hypothetical protein DAMNIGENAA_25210 [Desulforhabdus amnigena]|uniref:Fe/B12 periplasmic-binding domain-containing protein n=1 Tax=Desulforhabdus amnigena TaxID=40218 RepID=A0A9W6FUG8_9BACT|nr:hypothetical protein DAMNIGENAA_25210 [Desulforhabdus amnigena]
MAAWLLCMGMHPITWGSPGSVTTGESAPAAESVDLFPHKARLRFARCFTIEYHGTYKRLEVLTPWRNARETFVYILVYNARFLEDAGAHYLWRDDKTPGSIPLAIETVVERARAAEFWVDTGMCRSLAELREIDDRYERFSSFCSGKVFNNDARVNAEGGNDFWETGITRPDLVLADLISIFHPELVTEYRRIWYRQLPALAEEKQ